MKTCIGWDIGGAHLKAVLLDETRKVQAAQQIYCPLWQGLSYLEAAVQTVLSVWHTDLHVVTMTAELADIFDNRQQGVEQIVLLLSKSLPGKVSYYAGKRGLTDANTAIKAWSDVASMNWLASAEFTALHVSDGLFVDIGSTTTDLVLIHHAQPHVQAFSDAARMQCDELVYTGVVRTPLMAVAQKVKVRNQRSNVAAEYFATTADIYTLSGDLPSEDNVASTADGADKTMFSCARRLARMVGYDVNDAKLSDWIELALEFKQHQINQIKTAVQNQLSRQQSSAEWPIIGAGAGSFLVKEIAYQLGCPYQDVQHFITADKPDIKKMAAVCFPAYAVGFLGLSGVDDVAVMAVAD